MGKKVVVCSDRLTAARRVALYVIAWCIEHPHHGIGGATGRTYVAVWNAIWDQLKIDPAARERVVTQAVVFLDEYFGAFPSFYHWAWRNLRVGSDGFAPSLVRVPRGMFFEDGRVVTSTRLEEILRQAPADWEAHTVAGEDAQPPEIRIRPEATHPMLRKIRLELNDYEQAVRQLRWRLQLVGIGVMGHLGFVEGGGAARDTRTMVVRLATSTQKVNAPDFELMDADGKTVQFEPARHAITMGIDTILSAEALLLAAWGADKRSAVESMFIGTPGPLNPAAWVQNHPNVSVFLDQAVYGTLSRAALHDRGWEVELP